MVKLLFHVAERYAPSTIFFDEIDCLISNLKESQHEASKRFKSELFTQMDGITSSEGRVFILASTNSPWDLPDALLRRFDKRILIDMPDKEARIKIIKHNLGNIQHDISCEEFRELGTLTQNYSGSDIKNLAKEVRMNIVRNNIKAIKKRAQITCETIRFSDLKDALQKSKPSTNDTVCKKYHEWQNNHGAV